MAESKLALKKYLDYDGLQQFWDIIVNKFATKVEAAKVDSFKFAPGEDKVTMTYTNVSGTNVSETKYSDDIPAATSENAGVMTAADKTLLDSLKLNSNFKGIALKDGNNDAKDIAANQKAELTLAYETVVNEDLTKTKYIVLKDASTGSTAKTRLDVSEFVVDGILEDTELIPGSDSSDGKPWLKLIFKLADETTKEELVDMSSLVDIYSGSEGITISNNIVTLNAATDSTLGGIKIGYTINEGEEEEKEKTYAVQLDNENNAFVEVPWTDTTYTADGDDWVSANVAENTNTIVVGATTKLTDELGNIKGIANSKISDVKGEEGENALINVSVDENNVATVSSTNKLSSAVTAAETAVQKIESVDADDTYGKIKVEKDSTTYKISLDEGAQNNLELASTAIQSIIFGNEEDVNSYLAFDAIGGVLTLSNGTDDFNSIIKALNITLTADDINEICEINQQ